VSEELFEAFQPSPAPTPEANPSKTGRKKRGPRRQAAPTAAPTELSPIAPLEPQGTGVRVPQTAAEIVGAPKQKRQYTRRVAAPPATDDMELFSVMYEHLADMDKRRRARIIEMLAKVFA
jgi:hypothetical protein